MKRRKSFRPLSICISAASRFNFIFIFFPEIAERGASSSLSESLLVAAVWEEDFLRLLSFFRFLFFFLSSFSYFFFLSFLCFRFFVSFLAFFPFYMWAKK